MTSSARIRAAGGTADATAADLTDEAEVEAAVAACVEACGRIDGLLSVAGGSGRRFGDGPIHELTAEGWDRTLALNLRSQALVSRAVVRRMLAQAPRDRGARGAIVLVSSVLATHPVPELFATHAYAAAKGAIVSLALAMAAAYARDGIRVNVLAPGLTDTPMAARAAADPATVAFASAQAAAHRRLRRRGRRRRGGRLPAGRRVASDDGPGPRRRRRMERHFREPDVVTFVRTVLGDIDPSALGVTYAHEHLVIDRGRATALFPDFLLDDVGRMATEVDAKRPRSASTRSSTRCPPTPGATRPSWPT